MPELKLRVDAEHGAEDLVIEFDGQTTIAELVDDLERRLDRPGGSARTLKRISRNELYLSREDRIADADLRNGDHLQLSLDAGLRSSNATPAVAMLRVSAGSDAGRTFDLRRGETRVGRSAGCDLTLTDGKVSRHHATIRVTDIVEIADAASTHGVFVNSEQIAGSHRLRPGDTVRLGDTELALDLLGPIIDDSEARDNVVAFNRPPRIERPFQPRKVKLPQPVDPIGRQRIPLISALAPLLMGIVLYLVTRNILSVIFIGLSPVLLLANYFESKRSRVQEHKEAVAEFEATLHDRRNELDQLREQEIASRHRFAPDHLELTAAVAELGDRLWQRRPTDEDFMSLRAGLKAQASLTSVEIAEAGKRDQRRAMQDTADSYAVLPPVPLTFDGRREGPVGIAGDLQIATEIARSLVVQAAVLHSPQDLAVAAIVGEDNEAGWDWLKWLPHAGAAAQLVSPPAAVGADMGIELINALDVLVAARATERESDPLPHPHLVLVVDGEVPIEQSRFSNALARSARAGVTVIWIAPTTRQLPHSCRTVLSVEPGGTTLSLGQVHDGSTVGNVPIEPVDTQMAEGIARALSPIVDVSQDNTGESQVPKIVSLVELLGGVEVIDETGPIRDRWALALEETQGTGGAEARELHAPVGKTSDTDILSLDLRIDGPHGVVGGTTGAGKSEFLQALIGAFAASYSPDRMTFLLVDYKGGTAFGELVDQFDDDGNLIWRGLRHTVGMITDLTPALVDRALVSLEAELTRRKEFFGSLRRQNLAINDIRQLEAENKRRHARGQPPLPDSPPNLLIVVDEFAALKRDVPSFIEGIVNIAQQGRSFGMHLLLATQKPGGVIDADVTANTNLRVALRTSSEDESREIIDAPDAGRISRNIPGRGVMRLGPTDLIPFQSAYAGGVTTASNDAVLEVGELRLRGAHWLTARKKKAADTESDIKRLVRVVNQAAGEEGIEAPRRPWLDPLARNYDLADLPLAADDTSIPFGVADIPEAQTRAAARFHPDIDGSLLVYGTSGSGKTVALRTIAASFGVTRAASPVHIHAVDFAGRGLDLLEDLPHVGSVISGGEYDRIGKLLDTLEAEIAQRAVTFARARAATLAEYRAAPQGDARLARIVVLLDGYDTFHSIYERREGGNRLAQMQKLVAGGREVGVHFVLATSRSFPPAITSSVSSQLVFRLANDDAYSNVGLRPGMLDDASPSGRARFGRTEVQVATVGGSSLTSEEAASIRKLGQVLVPRLERAPEIRLLGERVLATDLGDAPPGTWALTDDFDPVVVDPARTVVIAGPPDSGKSTAVAAYGVALDQLGVSYTRYGPGHRSVDGLDSDISGGLTGVILVDDLVALAAYDGSPSPHANLEHALATGAIQLVASTDLAALRYAQHGAPFQARNRGDLVILRPDPVQDNVLVSEATIPQSATGWPRGRALLAARGSHHVVQAVLPSS